MGKNLSIVVKVLMEEDSKVCHSLRHPAIARTRKIEAHPK